MAYDEIVAAAGRISPHVRRTPVFSADHLGIAGQDLWLKLECLQVTGSFKARGATNRLLTLTGDAYRHGLVAASAAIMAWPPPMSRARRGSRRSSTCRRQPLR